MFPLLKLKRMSSLCCWTFRHTIMLLSSGWEEAEVEVEAATLKWGPLNRSINCSWRSSMYLIASNTMSNFDTFSFILLKENIDKFVEIIKIDLTNLTEGRIVLSFLNSAFVFLTFFMILDTFLVLFLCRAGVEVRPMQIVPFKSAISFEITITSCTMIVLK